MQGQLFTQDFLARGIGDTEPWHALDDTDVDRFIAALRAIYAPYSIASTLNEAQTEQQVIWPVLTELGWSDDWLPQVNASATSRESVPDLLLFPDAAAKSRALAERKDDRRYRHGIAIAEAKRWLRLLDRGDEADALDPGAPSSQMLRYLSRADVISDRAVKWGILTNGAVWRLYWQDARSRAEDFFELDVAALLGVTGVQAELDGFESRHGLKLFFLLFHRAAFLRQTWDARGRTFHQIAQSESRLYEERVSADLGARVFAEVFPDLARALAAGDPRARRDGSGALAPDYLGEVREAALVLLYRLLFVFYAEDRSLLPVRDDRYVAYSVRRLRDDVAGARDAAAMLSASAAGYWLRLTELFRLIADGDDSVGMPGYNGGLFDAGRAPLLARVRIADAQLAPVIDALSRRTEDVRHLRINYRDLSVAHLGGIYERLLEYSLVEEAGRIESRPASFARKTSGSYYTHDDLVRLILQESVGRLVAEKTAAFDTLIRRFRRRDAIDARDWTLLDRLDPATHLLELRVCDPAMGSGHFLVALVDFLADRTLEAINAAQQAVAEQPWAAHLAERGRPWTSPVAVRLAAIRSRIVANARAHGWSVTDRQLDDRHIVRRMILKRVIFGVDKNPMAVELAKVALWLHTFTVGAPLSFLDHHLKCGDSLHGERLETVTGGIREFGVLLQDSELTRLEVAARALDGVAELTDVDIGEVHRSAELAREAESAAAPIIAVLDFWRALRWLVPGWPVNKLARLRDEEIRKALAELFSGRYNLAGVIHRGHIDGTGDDARATNELLTRALQLARRERFFHWWTAFPTVFAGATAGFDAVIGNPPWDRIKLQQVEWFAERRPQIAMQARAADRKRMIDALEAAGDPLAREFAQAAADAETAARVFRDAGDFPLLSGGDINLYSLFVERAAALVAPQGVVGLLAPSGIAADKGAAEFFRGISGGGRLGALFDFENRNNPGGSFFPDVDSRFKFCVFVFGGAQRRFETTRCAFFLHAAEELDAPDRILDLSAADFLLVNPNTGAAPIFRTRRDAEITTRIYRSHPVLVDRSRGGERRAWPVRYVTMFHMTNDSKRFITREELVKRGWQPAELNRWTKGDAVAVPLYVGRMILQFDHRAADVNVNDDNLHNAALSGTLSLDAKVDPQRFAQPQYWIQSHAVPLADRYPWAVAFRDIARATDVRTMISAVVPMTACGNKLPLLLPREDSQSEYAAWGPILAANLNSLAFDFVARQKVQSTNINWYIVEQLPVIVPARFDDRIGSTRIGDFVRDEVLHLSYTAWDLAPFARDLGYVDARGEAKPPFVWDEEDRRQRIARLDALFMHLYGLSKDDADYILDTFPIVREKDEAAFGRYRTKELVLGYMERIADGDLRTVLGHL